MITMTQMSRSDSNDDGDEWDHNSESSVKKEQKPLFVPKNISRKTDVAVFDAPFRMVRFIYEALDAKLLFFIDGI